MVDETAVEDVEAVASHVMGAATREQTVRKLLADVAMRLIKRAAVQKYQ